MLRRASLPSSRTPMRPIRASGARLKTPIVMFDEIFKWKPQAESTVKTGGENASASSIRKRGSRQRARLAASQARGPERLTAATSTITTA